MSCSTLRRSTAARLLACSLSALMLAFPAGARAHAFLVRSDPAAGARLSAVPGQLRLYFSEPIVGGSERLAVRILNGSQLPLPAPADQGSVVLQRLPSRRKGVYLVDWHVLADDGHVTQGELAFAAGAGGRLPTLSRSVSQPTSWSQVVA